MQLKLEWDKTAGEYSLLRRDSYISAMLWDVSSHISLANNIYIRVEAG
jgi:hypothetical protein